MKKASSLSEQVQRAQQLLASWPDSRRSNLRLDGHDRFSTTALKPMPVQSSDNKMKR